MTSRMKWTAALFVACAASVDVAAITMGVAIGGILIVGLAAAFLDSFR